MSQYIVYGAGGHAKVVIDILQACDEEILGIIDDNSSELQWNSFPILGRGSDLKKIKLDYQDVLIIIAIGDNLTRMNIANRLSREGFSFGKAIHPSAIIGSSVSVGEGTVIMPNVVVNAHSCIGEHVVINTSATVDHDCKVDSFAHVSPGVHMAGNVQIGRCTIIGVGSSIIPGVNIGESTVVGAGSCVVKDIPNCVLAFGSPARVVKNIKN